MKKFRPKMYCKSIFDIKYDVLKEKGIKVLVFDLDNTIMTYDEKIPRDEVVKLFQKLSKDFKIFLASNNVKEKVRRIGKHLNVHGFYSVIKPSKRIRKLLLSKYSVEMNEVVIIGDQLVTDIFMGNRLMRCFRLKNYGDYESVSSNIIDYDTIFNGISNSNDLVLYVVDILNLPNNLLEIREKLSNDCILVLNKRDLLPLSVKDGKILEYLRNLNLGYDDMVVVGYTNAGKSSLISKFIKNYGDGDTKLTVAPLPTTTLDKIIIPINEELTLIDTPGLVDYDNIINFVDKKMFKKLNSKKEIKPKTYQLGKNESLLIGDLVRINYLEGDRNSLTFYIPNEIKIRRCRFKSDNLKNLSSKEYDVGYYEDLVILGLGFIKIVAACKLEIFINKDVLVYTRRNMI